MQYRTSAEPSRAGVDATAPPLTPMQQGMVYETIAQQRPWTNVQQIVCRSDERLDAKRLARAWSCAQDRHAVLRSRFVVDTPDPRLCIEAAAPIPLEMLDWSTDGAADRERRLQDWLADDRAIGIDLAQAPAQRLTLICGADEGDTLVWTFHHALLDGRSFTLVLEDVFGHYDDGCPLPGATDLECGAADTTGPSFADHARAVAERPVEPERQYFRRLLDGVDGPTRLPIGVDDPAGGPRPHANVERRVDRSTTDRLLDLADETGATLYTCLLGAWSIVLGRYARTTDVVFGSTRSGRHLIPGMADVAGCFINTVPTRVRVDPELTIRRLLEDIRADQVAVRPFEQAALVDATSVDHLPRGSSLLTTNVVFERYLMDSHLRTRGDRWLGRRFEVLEEGGFPLTLAGYQDDGLRLVIEFDADHHDPPLVEAMLGHLARLLEELGAGSPERTLAELDLLQPAERRQLLDAATPAGATSGAPSTRPASAPDLLDTAVAAHLDLPAILVAGSGDVLSYRELDRRANRLANLLVSRGIGLEDRVAICLPRSADHVVAQLAVGKAQAAFVPLDPAYPPAALAHMLSDSGAKAIVTSSSTTIELPTTDGCVTIRVDTEPDLADQPDVAPPRPDLGPDHLAYSIYTSGSTGIPKGVLISHRSLVAHAEAFRHDIVDLGTGDRALQFASLSFDTSIEEIVPTLASGACLVLRNDEMAHSLAGFLEATAELGVTVLNLPTAFWHELVRFMDERRARLPEGVRIVVIGGEKASAAAWRTWRRLVPDVPLVNAYGPTECTISATAHHSDRSAPERLTGETPIGRPLSHARAYVVDEREDLVPVGVPGELWLGGPGVARGYHDRPELTADRFRPDPFDDTPGARIYRTGDLVRWLPSGELEYLGRLDRQLKVRGYRIEPGEIEAAAERLPGVAQAFVAVHRDDAAAGDGDGDGVLVAWLSPVGRDTIDPTRAHARLRDTLPAHLVPAAVVVVDQLPVTAGGKVDRAALPPPDLRPDGGDGPDDGAADGDGHAVVDDELTRVVGEVFAEVLDRPGVEPDASFFDLGGHSLLALRLIDGLERRTGQRVTLPMLHDAPTARRLAATLAGTKDEAPYRYLLPVQPSGTRVPIIGVHVLGVNNLYFASLARALGPDWPVYGLTLGRIGTTELREVGAIAEAYAEEVERAFPTGPVVLAAISLGSVVTLELARRLTEAGREVALVALFDARGPGGQPELPPIRRATLHARLLLTARSDYLAPRLRHQLGVVRNRIQLARIRWCDQRGRTVPEHLRLLQADHEHAMDQEAHEIQPYDGPVALFRADLEVFDDPAWRRDGMGWSGIAVGLFHTFDVPGAHLSILAEPNVDVLADQLRGLLGELSSTPR